MNVFFVVHYRNGYLAYDYHSGGYPYETSLLDRATKFNTLSDAVAASKSAGYSNGVSKCTINVTRISDNEIQDNLRSTALSKLTNDEKTALGIKG